MKSFTTLQADYQLLTENTNAGNVAFGAELINQSIRTIASIGGGAWTWLEDTVTFDTVAATATYQIPNNVRKIVSILVTVGTQPYLPIPIQTPEQLNAIIASRLGTSDIPLFYYKENDTITLYPTPSDGGNTATMRLRLNIRDLTQADYTTGTIVSVSNGDKTVIGTGTSWNASFVGRWIRITNAGTANSGDGFWYKIASITSTTELELEKDYQGTTIAVATNAYTIGEMSPIPEAYEDAITYRSVAWYWQKQGDTNRANLHWRAYDGGVEAGLTTEYGGLVGQMMAESGEKYEGAWISPHPDPFFVDPNIPPRYPLTGF